MTELPPQVHNNLSVADAVKQFGYPYADPMHLVAADSRFATMAPETVGQAIKGALLRNADTKQHLPLTADKIFQAHCDLKAGSFVPPNPLEPLTILPARGPRETKKVISAGSLRSDGTRSSHQFFDASNKILGATSLVCAALSAVEVCKNMKQANQTQSDGKPAIQWSHVGMAMLNTAFTAGLAYVGIQQLRGRAIF